MPELGGMDGDLSAPSPGHWRHPPCHLGVRHPLDVSPPSAGGQVGCKAWKQMSSFIHHRRQCHRDTALTSPHRVNLARNGLPISYPPHPGPFCTLAVGLSAADSPGEHHLLLVFTPCISDILVTLNMHDHFQGRHSTLFNHLHKPTNFESSPLERGNRDL